MKKRKRKNAVFFSDPDQRGIPSVCISIEKAASNEATHVESFSELLQLSVNEEIMPRQLSS